MALRPEWEHACQIAWCVLHPRHSGPCDNDMANVGADGQEETE